MPETLTLQSPLQPEMPSMPERLEEGEFYSNPIVVGTIPNYKELEEFFARPDHPRRVEVSYDLQSDGTVVPHEYVKKPNGYDYTETEAHSEATIKLTQLALTVLADHASRFPEQPVDSLTCNIAASTYDINYGEVHDAMYPHVDGSKDYFASIGASTMVWRGGPFRDVDDKAIPARMRIQMQNEEDMSPQIRRNKAELLDTPPGTIVLADAHTVHASPMGQPEFDGLHRTFFLITVNNNSRTR